MGNSVPERNECNRDLDRFPSFVNEVKPATPRCEQKPAALPTLLSAPATVAPLPLSALPATACGLTRPKGFPEFDATIRTQRVPATYPAAYHVASVSPYSSLPIRR